MSQYIREIGGSNFPEHVLQAAGLVLVDFDADWCPPCKMLAPILEQFAKKYSGLVSVVRADTELYPELVETYQIWGLPTLILFGEGKPLLSISGYRPLRRLESDLAPYMLSGQRA